MFHRSTYMGPFSPNHTLAQPGDFSHPHRSIPGQRCGMRESRVGRALFSRNAVLENYHIRGKRMAIIPMKPVGPVTTLNRSIFLTERDECQAQVATISFAGTVDMSCWRISILQQSEVILSISAVFVRTTMTFHSPRQMLATGPHGEISQRLPWRKSKFSGAWARHFDARRSPGRGNAGASQVRDSCPGETSRTLLLVSHYTSLSNH
jgi:hypothetical protein